MEWLTFCTVNVVNFLKGISIIYSIFIFPFFHFFILAVCQRVNIDFFWDYFSPNLHNNFNHCWFFPVNLIHILLFLIFLEEGAFVWIIPVLIFRSWKLMHHLLRNWLRFFNWKIERIDLRQKFSKFIFRFKRKTHIRM